MNELEEAWKDAYTIDSMPAGRRIEPAGEKQGPRDYIYKLYKYDRGEYWFEIYVERDGKRITLDEAVFGKRRKR